MGSMKTASDLLEGAALIVKSREQQHGSKRANHDAIAAVWNGILEARRVNGKAGPLDALDVASLMEGLKIARRFSGGFNPDDYLDSAGYAACAFEIAAGGN